MNAKTITKIEQLHPSYVSPDENGEPTAIIVSISVIQALLDQLQKLQAMIDKAELYTDLSQKTPNAETLTAFKETEEGKTVSFDSVDDLMADLHA